MNFNSLSDLRQTGFEGFVAISTIRGSNCSGSIGGHFKRKNPTVAISLLKSKWVENTSVLYIGRAGGNTSATLSSRIKTYMRFGQGEAIGHWGGRLIWQLRDSYDLLICWKATLEAVPRSVEIGLIKEFEEGYCRLPFANLCH